MVAAKHNPSLFKTYLKLEKEVGADFKSGESLASIRDEIEKRRNAGYELNDLAKWVKKSLGIDWSDQLIKADLQQDPPAVGLILAAANQRISNVVGVQVEWKSKGACIHLDTERDSQHVLYLKYPDAYNASMVAAAFAQRNELGFEEHNVPGELAEEDLRKSDTDHKLAYRTKFQGFNISIENRKGSYRHWKDPESGTEGKTKMLVPYGRIPRTVGLDAPDAVDVFLGDDENAPNVYVVTQMKLPDFKEFDEQKTMIGFSSAKAAKAMYLAHFDKPGFFGSMKTIPVETFRKKVFAADGELIKAEQMGLDFTAKPKAPKVVSGGGPFIGPRGGKWKDAKHTIPWDDAPKKTRGKKGVKVPPPGVTTPQYLKALETSLINVANQPVSNYEDAARVAREAYRYVDLMRVDLLYTRGMWGHVPPSAEISKKDKIGKLRHSTAKIQEALKNLNDVSYSAIMTSDHQAKTIKDVQSGKASQWDKRVHDQLVNDVGDGDVAKWEKVAATETIERDLVGPLKEAIKPLMRAARVMAKQSTVAPLDSYVLKFRVGDMTIEAEDQNRYRLPALIKDPKRRSEISFPMNRKTVAQGVIGAKRLLEEKGLGHLWYGALPVRPKGEFRYWRDDGLGIKGSPADASYSSHGDAVKLYGGDHSARRIQQVLVHELGHRYWYQKLSSGDREKFVSQFGKVKATSEYGATAPEEDFAEVFADYVTNKDMTRDQIDRFKTYLGKSELADLRQEELIKSGGPFIGPKGGKWADAKHTIPWKEGHHAETTEHGEHFQTGKPVKVHFSRNTTPSPKLKRGQEDRFQQRIEPAGRYLVHVPKDSPVLPGSERGDVHFKNPIVLHINPDPSSPIYNEQSWKARLSKHYGGKKGKALSAAIARDGHDGIVTVDKYGTSEIVDLTFLHKSNPAPSLTKALTAIDSLVKGEGYPPHHPSPRPSTVGTMGRYGGAARTAGESVRPGKIGMVNHDWPVTDEDKKKKRRKQEMEAAEKRFDVTGLTRGKGHVHDMKVEDVTMHVVSDPQDYETTREGLDRRLKALIDLASGMKLDIPEVEADRGSK
jgi:hypothetical protein